MPGQSEVEFIQLHIQQKVCYVWLSPRFIEQQIESLATILTILHKGWQKWSGCSSFVQTIISPGKNKIPFL